MRLGISEMVCLVFFIFLLFFLSWFVIKKQKVFALCMVVFLLLGFVAAGIGDEVSPLPETTTGNYWGDAVVREVGRSAAGNQKIYTTATLSSGESVGLYILWTGKMEVSVGDKLYFTGEILPLSVQRQWGGYDEAKYLKTKGMAYKLFPETLKKTGLERGVIFRLEKIKARVFQVFDTVFAPKERGIVKAMVTGETADILPEIKALYTKAGITHILCISGLHISVLAYSFYHLLTKICRRNKQKSAAVTILFVLAFLIFTGFSPSSVRAFIMVSMVFLAQLVWRKSEWLNNLALAAGVILLVEPLYLWSPGFQLSFVTAFGIWFSLRGYEIKAGRFGKIRSAFRVSLFASLFSFPLVAYHFYYVSLIGILVNLAIVPLCGILLGFCLLTAVGGLFFPPIAAIAGGGAICILKFYEAVCTLGVMIPGGYFLVGVPSLGSIFFYYGLIGAVLFSGKTIIKYSMRIFFGCALFFSIFGNRLFWKENTVAFLDVGQGDATVISTYDGQAIVIDGGGKFGKALGENTGMTVVVPYLESLGIRRVQGVFFTHFDRDHMLGALEVCQEMDVGGVYVSPYLFQEREGWEKLKEMIEKEDILLYTVDKDDQGQWRENGTLLCLWPEAGVTFTDEDDNHGSLVLNYTYGGTRVLLMGDATAADEAVLVQTKAAIETDILKLGHHGSNYSSTADFLEATKTDYAIISCGLNNMYGHPQEEVLERLEKQKVTPYRTDYGGTILAKLSPKGTYEIMAVGERKTVYERIEERLEGR